MKKRVVVFALGLTAAAGIAMAHSGATGVVLERMTGMTAMRDIMRDLAPMMQGATPYDALAVSEGGYLIASHAGDTMRALFPNGSLEGVTYANPTIWTEWEEFSALADALRAYAEALSKAAPNGFEPVPMVMSGMKAAAVSGTPKPEVGQSQKIASLLGYAAPKGVALAPASRSNTPAALQATMSELGAGEIFEQISGSCSACHARFRKGRS